MAKRLLSALVLCLGSVSARKHHVDSSNPNLITNLPGAPTVSFNQYSGYINVNKTNGRNLFYWFVEAATSPSTAPLVLWLNGGPGCSSIAGLLGENGPLRVNKDGSTLSVNPYSWNQIANVIYLDSPSGVGFSYSDTPSDYVTGDAQTASDSVAFIHSFLEEYPAYANSEFWITGESYGGHYVPNLALAILKSNQLGQSPKINLQGFQVGNAWTVAELDNKGAATMWWTHAFISDSTYSDIMQYCDFTQIGPLSTTSQLGKDPQLCDNAVSEANNVMSAVNIYQLYNDVCTSSHEKDENQGTRLMRSVARASKNSVYKYHQHPSAAKTHSSKKHDRHHSPSTTTNNNHHHTHRVGDEIPDPDPCLEQHMTTYMNQESLFEALHVSSDNLPGSQWSQCSQVVQYSRTDLLTSMIPVYEQLLSESTLKILVFSGDVDGIVPVPGTRTWINSLNLTDITDVWRPWYVDQQTGGYTQTYKGESTQLTFATVRSAGHMVPYTQPHRSLELFKRFLTGQPL